MARYSWFVMPLLQYQLNKVLFRGISWWYLNKLIANRIFLRAFDERIPSIYIYLLLSV